MSREFIQANYSMKQDKVRENNYSNLFINGIDDVRLKISTISNNTGGNVDNLDISNVYNNGKVAIRWTNYPGSVIGGSKLSGNTNQNNTNNYPYKVKDRTQSLYVNNNIGERAITKLTYPFLWTGQENGRTISCGMNYIPPNNARMLTAILDNGETYGLNYIIDDINKLYPILKPGEIAISGYGNNYIHWGQSDKIQMYCCCNKDEYDKDGNNKKNDATCELELNINSNDKIIEIIVNDITHNEKTFMNIESKGVKIETHNYKENCYSQYEQTCDHILKKVHNLNIGGKSSTENIEADRITINTDNFIINSKNFKLNTEESTNINATNITMKAIETISLNAKIESLYLD